jgi:CRP/FNR family transcriptional regulator, cyclic AMP receptor protein
MATRAKALDLSTIWLFSTCSAKELRLLRGALEEADVRAGTVLTAEHTRGREFFLIIEGTASVTHLGKRVATLGPDRYFGELSLLDRGSRSATVTADTAMRLLVLGQREFHGILAAVPTLTRKLLAVTATRLRESDELAYP